MSICFGKKIVGIALFFALGAAGAFANTLSEVQINADEQGYNIVLKTETAAQMKKVVNSPDKMSIELKDIKASEELNTVYNNVSNIDNVTIQPLAKQDLKITLKGKGISSSKIYFEEAKTLPAALPQEESIELNPPVNSYSPVYTGKMLVQDDQTSNPQVNAALTKMNISRDMLISIKNVIKGFDSKFLGMLFVFVILAGATVVMFKPRKDVKSSFRIGLSGNLKNTSMQREIALAKDMDTYGAMRLPSGGARMNYGMNAYKQSQRNPYMTNNLAQHRTGVSGIPRKSFQGKKASVSQPVVRQQAPYAAPSSFASEPVRPALNSAPVQMTMPQADSVNVDSMKFLESITKIYEKNGREDLAKGLKDNLKKAKMTKMPV